MSNRICLQTKNCIVCGKPATQWTGHVTATATHYIQGGVVCVGRLIITSGFCDSDECRAGVRADADGCHGDWNAAMGAVIWE